MTQVSYAGGILAVGKLRRLKRVHWVRGVFSVTEFDPMTDDAASPIARCVQADRVVPFSSGARRGSSNPQAVVTSSSADTRLTQAQVLDTPVTSPPGASAVGRPLVAGRFQNADLGTGVPGRRGLPRQPESNPPTPARLKPAFPVTPATLPLADPPTGVA